MGFSFHLTVTQRQRKRKRRRIRTKIPMEVVMDEILARLPAKSHMKFKCVSKLWSSFICSRYFSNRFVTVPSHRPRLYMFLADLNKSPRKDVILSLVPDASTNYTSFVVDHDLTITGKGGYIWQNLGGFMCFTNLIKLRIYNPATRQFVMIPTIKSNVIIPRGGQVEKIFFFFFGHDPVNNQYKAICSISPSINTMPEHWVYVLKAAAAGGGGASWKQVAPTGFRPHIPDIRGGLCTNGVIYYLARIDHEHNYVLISFHVRSEEFKMIHEDDEMPCRYEYATLIEYEGKVTLLDHTNLRDRGMLNLWNVGDARNKMWSRKTLVLQPSQLHFVSSTRVWVKGTTQSGKILLIALEFPCRILCYDMQRNDMRKFEIKGVSDHWYTVDKDDIRFDFMLMDQSESVMHLET